jgi:8-oxo-dGTP diphosphatase
MQTRHPGGASVSDRRYGELIRAAGGLVWRTSGKRREVLVIHRPRYNDWTLPKGKVKAGECWEDAARREVEEETGYHVEIDSFADILFYYVEGRPKVILFWNMHPSEDEPSAEYDSDSPDEGDAVRWLTIQEALELITYDSEKALIQGISKQGKFADE